MAQALAQAPAAMDEGTRSLLPYTRSLLPYTRSLLPHTRLWVVIGGGLRGWQEKKCPTGTKFPERRKLDFKSFLEKRTAKGFRSTLKAKGYRGLGPP